MVAVIKTSSSLRNVLHYNENKLKQNAARLIYSQGFAKDKECLGFTDKIRTFEKFCSLNERTKLNTVHISLNFHPSEKLDAEILSRIAETYLQKIGFKSQPCLVYEHYDAGHPHIHLVTTNIQRDGRRIKMQNIGRNQSEKARKEIEKEFGLTPAQKEYKLTYELKPVPAQRVQYGKVETKRAIANVLDRVLASYKYSSLPELNAVLRGYNLMADGGSEGSRIAKAGGLVYRILDEKGKKIGAPVKASAIYSKPTLKFLQERFRQNEIDKQQHRQRLKNVIDFALATRPGQPLKELIATLSKENIQAVLRQNDQGLIYGMTYVDHQTRCVFNGSDLGKPYSAKGIQQRCSNELTATIQTASKQHQNLVPAAEEKKDAEQTLNTSPLKEIVKELTQAEYDTPLADELKREQFKKRKRKRLHH